MKRIEYRVTFGDGRQTIMAVSARTIESGFAKATARAARQVRLARREARGQGERAELHSIEFWQVTS